MSSRWWKIPLELISFRCHKQNGQHCVMSPIKKYKLLRYHQHRKQIWSVGWEIWYPSLLPWNVDDIACYKVWYTTVPILWWKPMGFLWFYTSFGSSFMVYEYHNSNGLDKKGNKAHFNEDHCPLGCDIMQFDRTIPTFQRNLLPPLSG